MDDEVVLPGHLALSQCTKPSVSLGFPGKLQCEQNFQRNPHSFSSLAQILDLQSVILLIAHRTASSSCG